MNPPFGERVAAAVAARGPLCVGIDPHPKLLAGWGLPASAEGLRRFALTAVTAVAGEVAAVKPQSAFFEAHGAAGMDVLAEVIAAARAAGALVIADVKRGDIGSTMAAYATAWLGPQSPLAADAVTLSPYPGFEALAPAFEEAARCGRGVFVLARTSTADGDLVQLARLPDGRTVAQAMVDAAAPRNCGARPTGDTGVVVGATQLGHGLDLSGLNGPILAPGLGAQGAAPADLPAVFGDALPHVLPSAARSVLARGPDQVALRDAVSRLRDELAALGEGRLRRDHGSAPADRGRFP
jgi:orotidine-5'-phosphate decarboxylase